MERRKLQVVGNGTYTVSLPKEWADEQGVAAGETVTLHDHVDGVLAIQTGEGDPERPDVTVRTSATDPASLERTLRAAYAAGATAVRLDRGEPATAEERRAIDRVVRNRIGMSMAEESDTGGTVRILLDSEEVSVRQSVRQLAFTVVSMQQNAIESLSAGTDRAGSIGRGEQADRLSAMVERSVARGMEHLAEVDALGMTRPELFEAWTAMRELERVRDAARGIATVAARMGERPTETHLEEIRGIGRETRSIVSDGVAVVVGDGGVETAGDVLEAGERVRGDIESFDRRLAEADGGHPELRAVLDRLRGTADRGERLAELGLRRAIRREELTSEPIPRREQ